MSTTQAIEALWSALGARAEHEAWVCGEARLTYGALEARARRYAGGLRALGVRRGDRVAAVLGTSLDVPAVLLGHYLLGAVHVPINTRYGSVELEHILNDSGATVAVLDGALSARDAVAELATEGRLPALRHRIVRDAPAREGEQTLEALMASAPVSDAPSSADEDPALFIYTSGTTGRSKGVVLPYRAVVANIDALTRLWRWESGDRLVLALPLFHVHGLCLGVHGVLLRGCSATLLPRFTPEAVAAEVGAGGSIFMGVPTMYTRLVRAMDRDAALAQTLSQARLFTSGSAALSADVFAAFEAHTGHRILERYGMSETLLTVSNPYAPERRKPGTIGFAVPSGEVQVVDDAGARCAPGVVGELEVRGASLMTGYWNAPDTTAASMREGWFRTGDAARYDPEGYIVHVGRRSVDILKCGGYKISAREIEEAIARHADIDEVAVVGLPDPEWGQRIAAAVVPNASAPPRDADAWLDLLRDALDGVLADFKRPREVRVLEALPRNALGKVQKHRIVAQMSADA